MVRNYVTFEMSKNSGITSILNKHYNDNHEHFEPDIDSDNLKTVLLKIGERPNLPKDILDIDLETEINKYFKNLPRKKRKIQYTLNGDNKQDTVNKTIIDYKIYKKLDNYFEDYGKCRRLLLKEIYRSWCNENKEYQKSSCELMGIVNEDSVQPLSKSTYDKIIELEKSKNKDKLNSQQTQELTNAFHQWVRNFIKQKELSNQIKEFGMDRLLPNLYEDISGGLVGFFRKLISAECEYEKEIINIKNFIIELISYDQVVTYNPYKHWDKTNFYGKIIDSYLHQSCSSLEYAARKKGEIFDRSQFNIQGNAKVSIYLEFREAIENAGKLSLEVNTKDLLSFNNVYNQLRKSCEIIKHHTGRQQKEFEFMFKKKEGVVKLINSREKTMIDYKATRDGSFTTINPLFFDPKKTFPLHEDQNTLDSLCFKINDLYDEIDKHKSNENLSIIEISKKKIFKEPFLSIKNKERNAKGKMVSKANIRQELFEKEENTPNGSAHKVFNDYYILAKDGKFKGNYLKTSNGNFAKDKYSRNIKILEKEDSNKCYKQAKCEVIKEANLEIEKLYTKINMGTIKEDYSKLRDLAGWIWVKMRILIEEADFSSRERLIKEISELASTISGFAYNLERSGYENQSIYLSDFLTRPQDKINDDNFKSSAYLTTENRKKLSLAISFKSAIFKDEDSRNKALVYTFDEGNDEKARQSNLQNKNSDKIVVQDKWDKNFALKYFNYEYWNKIAPLAYKSFTKPNIEIGIGESEFVFPLHFGINQSRKYFWNKSRGTGYNNEKPDNLVHDIFNENSRLKVSSMRLIRKFNPIKTTWEYYLSLAIYRLEEAKVELSNNVTNIGVDIGDNLLIALNSCKSQDGFKVNIDNKNINKHIANHKTFVSNTLDIAEKSQATQNYIDPEIRYNLKNKQNSIKKQTSAHLTKQILKNETDTLVAFERDYFGENKSHSKLKNPKEQMISYLKHTIHPFTYGKLTQEISKKSIDNLLVQVPTDNTSQICSQCGHIGKNSIDSQKIIDFLNSDEKLLDLRNCLDQSKINVSFFNNEKCLNLVLLKSKNLQNNTFPWVFDISHKNAIDQFSKIDKKGVKIDFKINDKNHKKDYIEEIANSRPSWYYENSETFRCLICGYICPCDDQAALNIARYQTFLQPKLQNKIDNYTIPTDEIAKTKDTISRMQLNNSPADKIKIQTDKLFRLQQIPIDKLQEELFKEENTEKFITWYQTQLLKHGYDDNGNAKWNQPQQAQPLN
jgi:hypothetical protein